MMKKILFIFALNAISVFFMECREPLIMTSDFLKTRGEVSSIVQYTHYETDHFWNRHGDKKKAYNRLRQNEIELYSEVGITNCDTLGIDANYVNNEEKLNWTSRGFGDVELCWKRYLASAGGYLFSSRIVGIIPVGDKKTTVRYGEWGFELDLHCQKDFMLCNRFGWYELLGGYRYYHGFPSDQIKFHAVVGYHVFDRFRIIGGLYLNYGIENGKQFHGPILTLPPRYRLLKAEIHGVVHLANCVSVFVGGFQHLWGENIGTGGGLTSGLWVDF